MKALGLVVRTGQYCLMPKEPGLQAYTYIPLWAPGGRDAALDVCIVSPFQQATLERGARESGFALQMRHQYKWAKYGEACRAEGIEFYPLPVETTGGWEEGAVALIKRLGKAMARASCQEEGEAVRHLFGRLSVLLMRANASMILNRVLHHTHPSINGAQ